MVDPRIVVIMECHEKLTNLLPDLDDNPVVKAMVMSAVASLGIIPAPELPEEALHEHYIRTRSRTTE